MAHKINQSFIKIEVGMAGGFTFTGINHIVSAHNRYAPMAPDFLADYALG